jgi:hypothetical protein
VPRATVSAQARHGVWRTTEPVLADGGTAAVIRAGGRVVTVHLADGRIVVD